MKSTFFLVVLFGLQYVLFVFLPVEVSSLMFKIWTFIELALSSVQVKEVNRCQLVALTNALPNVLFFPLFRRVLWLLSSTHS